MRCLRTETHCGFCHAAILYGPGHPMSKEEVEEIRKRNTKSRVRNQQRTIELRRLSAHRESRVHPDGLLCMTWERTGKVCHHHRHEVIRIKQTA